MRSKLLSFFLVGIVLAACQGLPEGYANKPDIKVLAESVSAKGWYAVWSGCSVERSVRLAVTECEARGGGTCKPAFIGNQSVRGKMPDEVQAILQAYQTRYDSGGQDSANPEREFYNFSASFDSPSGDRGMDGGTATILHIGGCKGTIALVGREQSCSGEVEFGHIATGGRLFPQLGEITLDCDDGLAYAGEYVLFSRQYGRAELTAADGTSVRALISTSSAIADMDLIGFDAVWNKSS